MNNDALSPELLQKDGRLLAGGQLSVRRADLSAGQSAAAASRCRLEHIKPRLLGHWGTTPGQNFIYVHLNRVIKAARPEHDLHLRPRAWRAGAGGQYVSRRHLQRGLSRLSRRMSGDEEAVQAVLLSRRHSQPCRAGNAGLDSRGRRAGIFAEPCLRRGVRQSRT